MKIHHCFIALSILIAFSACSRKHGSEMAAWQLADEGFQNANSVIVSQNTMIHYSLLDKANDPKTAEKAQRWLDKAQLIKEYTDSVVAYIDRLKAELKSSSEVKSEDGTIIFHDDNMDAVQRLFEDQKQGTDLEMHIQNYKRKLLNVDSSMSDQLGHNLVFISRDYDLAKTKSDFTKMYFYKMPVIAGLLVLDKLENNAHVIENKFITYCNNQISNDGFIIERIATLVGQSTTHLLPGQKLTIEAGVGSYSMQALPNIKIDGTSVDAKNGYVEFTKYVPLKPGKYHVPVVIQYIDENGNKIMNTHEVEYAVDTPCANQ